MTTDLRLTLAAADPVQRVAYDDAELLRRSLEILATTDEVVATAADDFVVVPPDTTARSPQHPRRGRMVGVLAVAAALAAAVALVPTLAHRASDAHERAAGLLTDAADAITASDPPARADQYWQITRGGFALVQLGGTSPLAAALVVQPTTSYVPVDGTRATVVVTQAAVLKQRLVGSDREVELMLAGPNPIGVSTIAPPAVPTWQTPTAAFLARLPRDPAALAARLRADTAGQGNSADGEVVVTVADVLRSGLVPPDLRAALFHVLAAVPGLVVSSDQVVVDGVRGVGFAYDEAANGIRQELIVDPTTGVLVAERETTTRALYGYPAGTVIGQSTSTRALVDAVPDTIDVGAVHFTCVTDANGSVTCSG